VAGTGVRFVIGGERAAQSRAVAKRSFGPHHPKKAPPRDFRAKTPQNPHARTATRWVSRARICKIGARAHNFLSGATRSSQEYSSRTAAKSFNLILVGVYHYGNFFPVVTTNCSAINRNRFALQLVAADTQRPFADPNCSNQFVSTARSAPLPASRFMPKGLQKSDVGVRKEAGAAEARMLTSALGAGVDLQKTTVHTSAHRRAPRSRCH
jgi:hypothetical protein